MPIDVAGLSVAQPRNLVENHRRRGVTDTSLYLEAFRGSERRTAGGLDFDKSLDAIRAAAANRCIGYRDLADASGAVWTKVHYEVGRHLWRLVEYADRRGWPMLSAIVVNQPNVASGRMDPATLRGFANAGRALGHVFADGEAFLREQQKKVFDWARTGAPSPRVA